jgi:hypothetical protein
MLYAFFIPIRLWRWSRQSVPKRRHIKFRRWGITQKKAYNGLLLSILSLSYGMNDIQAVFFQTTKTHTSFLLYQSWRFCLHLFLGHVIILKLRTEVPWWDYFDACFPPANPPLFQTQSSTLYLVVVRMARNVRKYPGWEGIAAGGRYDGGSFT